MSATDGFEEFEEFEDDAEELARRAYNRVVLPKVAVVAASYSAFLLLTAADYVFAVTALWYAPRWGVAFIAAGLAAEFTVTVTVYWPARRRRKAAMDALAPGERSLAHLDSMRDMQLDTWWQRGPETFRFWLGLGTRTAYSTCFGLVVTAWAGMPAGYFAGPAYLLLAMAAGWWVKPATTGFTRAAGFIDPRSPRDTPEA